MSSDVISSSLSKSNISNVNFIFASRSPINIFVKFSIKDS